MNYEMSYVSKDDELLLLAVNSLLKKKIDSDRKDRQQYLSFIGSHQ